MVLVSNGRSYFFTSCFLGSSIGGLSGQTSVPWNNRVCKMTSSHRTASAILRRHVTSRTKWHLATYFWYIGPLHKYHIQVAQELSSPKPVTLEIRRVWRLDVVVLDLIVWFVIGQDDIKQRTLVIIRFKLLVVVHEQNWDQEMDGE